MRVRKQYSEDFLQAFHADCMRAAKPGARGLPADVVAAGIAELNNMELTIAEMRQERPDLWLRTAVQLVPKQVELGVGSSLIQMLEDLRDRSDRIEQLDPYEIPAGGRIIHGECAEEGEFSELQAPRQEEPVQDTQPTED